MGANSSDALKAFMDEYLKRCLVVGNKILNPEEAAKVEQETAGGLRLPTAPARGVTLDGSEPDFKRGQ